MIWNQEEIYCSRTDALLIFCRWRFSKLQREDVFKTIQISESAIIIAFYINLKWKSLYVSRRSSKRGEKDNFQFLAQSRCLIKTWIRHVYSLCNRQDTFHRGLLVFTSEASASRLHLARKAFRNILAQREPRSPRTNQQNKVLYRYPFGILINTIIQEMK